MHQVTILIPHYKTPLLTKLCLGLLKKYTDLHQVKIMVIDNDSQDESVDYLRKLPWITFVERKPIPQEPVHLAHSRALDLALAQVDTPYVLSIHTDTLMKDPEWLPFLLAHLYSNSQLAGVGSWKLEKKSWPARVIKNIETHMQKIVYKIFKKKRHALEGVGDNHLYLRSHCALYQTDLLKELKLHFSDGDGVAGKALHKNLTHAGYAMKFLASEDLLKYMDHINHATMILNPALGANSRTIKKGLKRIQARLDGVDVKRVLEEMD